MPTDPKKLPTLRDSKSPEQLDIFQREVREVLRRLRADMVDNDDELQTSITEITEIVEAGVSSVAAGSSKVTSTPTTGAVIVDVVPANFVGIPESGVTNLVSDLAGKAPLSHAHAESDITGLVSDLASKVSATRAVNTTAPIAGGGDLSVDRTISLNDDGITDAKLRNSAALSVIGRSANSTGDPGDITTSVDGDVLRRSGTSLGFGQIATAGITDDAVTYAKMQNVSATSRLLGRITAGSGDPEELTGTQATTLLDAVTSSLKGLAPASGGGTANFLRADGTWAAPVGGVTGSGTTNTIPKWTGATALGDSRVTDDGTTITAAGNTTLGTAGTSILTATNGLVKGLNPYEGSHFEWVDDFLNIPNGPFSVFQIQTSGGNFANATSVAGRFGIVQFTTAASSSSNAGVQTQKTFQFSDGSFTFEWVGCVPTLSGATEAFETLIGFCDNSANTGQLNGCFFVYDSENNLTGGITAGLNPSKLQKFQATNVLGGSTRTTVLLDGTSQNGSGSAGSITTVDYTLTAGTYMHLKILVASTQAQYYVNGTLMTTLTTNTPTTNPVAAAFRIRKAAGTTARTLNTDYARVALDLAAIRTP